MTTYEIREVSALEAPPVGRVDARTDRDALAEYAVRSGFADPRESEEGAEFFYIRRDGRTGMIFTNTELYAVPVSRGGDDDA